MLHKNFFRQIHLALACCVCVFLIVLSVTGALLVYAKDIQAWWSPHYWLVEPPNKSQLIDYDQLLENAEKAYSQPVSYLSIESQRDKAWQGRFLDGKYFNVNPYTAQVLVIYDYTDTLYGFTLYLHRWLLWQQADDYPLRNLVSTAVLLFIILCLVGLYLWAKPAKRLKRLRIKPHKNKRIFYYQLHSVIGVYLTIPLVLIAFSGLTFNWSKQTSAVIEFITRGPIEARAASPQVTTAESNRQLSWQKAISQAMQSMPDAQLQRIYFAKPDEQVVMLRVKNPGEFHPYSYIWFNQLTGEVLQTQNASIANVTTQIWNFRYPFHIGNFAGPLLQFFWFILGLSPLLFVFTGGYLFIKRKCF
ncbi:PepSY-associated TM helix domain-containing protein [Catenovulum agarivorans]|uniref:PepSY-associated TM helix domain-containing protein n=1 Tax=Catenovulum agarivorans TaxID=1172192 RepID=UPI0005566BF4|nr:PepSY-associated TM helix domain-containing protein [Catenovulum agarivorans]